MQHRLGLWRLGLLGRLVLIVLSGLLAFIALALALSFIAAERRDRGAQRFPVAAQAAAIIALLDATPAADRPAVIRAVSGESFLVRLQDGLPEVGADGTRMPFLEWLVAEYLETSAERAVLAYRTAPPAANPVARAIDRLTGHHGDAITIAVALQDRQLVAFEIQGPGARRLLGVPVGFLVGVLGFLFAAAALWAIAREARPLRELAQSVERFAAGGAPHLVAPHGAPEIRRLMEATNTMQQRIAALIKGRTMLLGAISHDLKTYITRLRLRAEAIEPESLRLSAGRDLAEMTRLIDDGLAVARGGTAPERRERVDLAALVGDEVARRREGGGRLDCRLPAEPAVVQGDPVGLRRVVANLLDNAGAHAQACRVALAPGGGAIALVVEDDGPGIPESEREAVFEPFYRLEPSRSRATGGSGLGLTIARQIVEAHGGTIVLDQSDLGGARFRVQLPAAPAGED